MQHVIFYFSFFEEILRPKKILHLEAWLLFVEDEKCEFSHPFYLGFTSICRTHLEPLKASAVDSEKDE